ncbi:MFS transporter [Burkholderia multivorans]|uniref:MFS transporter n=2 Tax=Burkholderia multivorans TaxID=87883 RepID=A0AB37AZD4_9BURK|nr:MFS transporter [Burkholderia multivorans]PRE55999.1 MFS transporter [Burkholderia multivorans]
MTLSSFGQTFYISLFGAHFRHDFGLTDGGLGAVYAIATLGSAFSLTVIGRWIDHTTVRRYALCVAALLSCACLLLAASHYLPLLFVGLYCLRLGGQGLMVHTSLTTTARTFPIDRGKALGITTLGLPLGEATLPLLAVATMESIGWRATWVIGALVVLSGSLAALRFLPTSIADSRARDAFPDGDKSDSLSLWRDRRLLLTMPCILASPFISTGFFFHQARLVEEKHWSLQFVAACFVGYALARAVSLLTIGPVIDRVGARRMLPYFLVPQGLAMITLAFVTNPIGAPIYLIATGVSSGIAATMATALWVEMYGPHQLARVRSSVEAANVVASGAAPIVMGQLIDLGMPLATQAGACLLGVALVSWLSRRAAAYAVPAVSSEHSTSGSA